VADAFKRYALLEVSMQRNGCVGMASLLENIDPAFFQALEGFDIIRRVRELNAPGAASVTGSDSFVRPCLPRGARRQPG
jgi:hypothetical protein